MKKKKRKNSGLGPERPAQIYVGYKKSKCAPDLFTLQLQLTRIPQDQI